MCKESGIKISKYDAEKKKSKPKTRAELVQELEAYCLGEAPPEPSRPEGGLPPTGLDGEAPEEPQTKAI